jgi:hypothetical protein
LGKYNQFYSPLGAFLPLSKSPVCLPDRHELNEGGLGGHLYVEAHVDQKISLAELAGVTQLGVFSFIRKFQAEFGTTARPALPVQAMPERGLRASSEKKKEEKRAANEDLRKVNLAWFDPNRNTLYLGKVPGWRRHAGQLNSHELNYSRVIS